MSSVQYNQTGQTVYFMLTDSSTNLRKTGIAYAAVDASYTRDKSSRVAITAASLSGPNAAWSSGGWAEVDSTNSPGLYRLDVPDAAFVYGAGIGKVEITVLATGCHAETTEIYLSAPVITQGTIGASVNDQTTYTAYSMLDGTVRKDYK